MADSLPTTYALRKNDTVSHAALALLEGLNRQPGGHAAITPSRTAKAMADLAATNNLHRFRITQRINSNTDEQQFIIQELGSNGAPVGRAQVGKWLPLGKDAQSGKDGKPVYDCVFEEYRHANGKPVQPGENLRMPQGYKGFAAPSAIVLRECANCIIPPAPVPPAPEQAPAAVAPAPEVTGVPLAQLIVNPKGTVADAVDLDTTSFFLGRPPKDAAAEWRGTPDRLRDGLKPGTQEGTRVNGAAEKGALETFGFVPEAAQLKLSRAHEGNGVLDLFPNSKGELEFAPGQHIRLDKNGKPVAPNPNLKQKLENGPMLVVDAQGDVRTALANHALISENRRENPEYSGFLREAFTARNRMDALSNTGEGQVLATTYLGINRAYNKIGKVYYEGTPTAADAEKLLQLNVQSALHPFVWSVDPYGVPTKGAAVLRSEMDNVIAKLPDGAEKTRLIATYITPYADKLANPVALAEATKEARKGWLNPMQDWAKERLELDYIRKGYGDVPIPEELQPKKLVTAAPDLDGSAQPARLGTKEIDAFRAQEAARVGAIYARQSWQASIRAPKATELALGTGQLIDATAQKESALSSSRVKLLETLRDNPQAREAWMNHMLATPGGLQNVSDLLHFSSNENSGNYQLLGFADAEKARSGALDLASKMAGAEKGKALMRDDGSFFENVGNSMARFVTVGLWSPGKNRNQNNGLFGFEEAVAERWQDPKQKPAVDAALKEVVERAIAVEGKAPGNVASSALVLTMDPNRAEDLGATGTATALFAKLGASGTKTAHDQMVANLDHAGQRYVSAKVVEQTASRAAAGGVATVSKATASAAAAAGAVTLEGAERPAVTQPSTVAVTTLPTDAKALKAAASHQTPNAALVSQEQMNASLLSSAAKASPASVATLMVGAIVAAEKAGNKDLVATLKAQVANLSDSHGSAGSHLAKLMNEQVAAVQAANGSAEALAASGKAFEGFFAGKTGFFGGNDAKVNAIAAGTLASALVSNPAAAAAVAAPLQASGSALLAALPAGEAEKLNAIGKITDPARQQAALAAFAGQHSDALNNVMAGPGISLVEAGKWALLVYLTRPKPEKPAPDQPLNQGPVPECTPQTCVPVSPPVAPPVPTLPPVVTPPPAPVTPLPPIQGGFITTSVTLPAGVGLASDTAASPSLVAAAEGFVKAGKAIS